MSITVISHREFLHPILRYPSPHPVPSGLLSAWRRYACRFTASLYSYFNFFRAFLDIQRYLMGSLICLILQSVLPCCCFLLQGGSQRYFWANIVGPRHSFLNQQKMKQATGIPIQLPPERPQYVSCGDLLLSASTSSRQPDQLSIPPTTSSIALTTSQPASPSSSSIVVSPIHLSKSTSTSISTLDIDGPNLDSSCQPQMVQCAEPWQQQPDFAVPTNWQINSNSEYQTCGGPQRTSNSSSKSQRSQDAPGFDQIAGESMMSLLYDPSFPIVSQQGIWPTSTEASMNQPFNWPLANISDNLAHLHLLPNRVQSVSVITAQQISASADEGHGENLGKISNHEPPANVSNQPASISDDNDDDDVQLLFVGPASKRQKKRRYKKRDDQNIHETLASSSQCGNPGLNLSHVTSPSSREIVQVDQKSVKGTLPRASGDHLSASSPSKGRISPKTGKPSKVVNATIKDTPQPQNPDLSLPGKSGVASMPTNASIKASRKRRKSSSSPQNQPFQDDMPLTKRTNVPKKYPGQFMRERADATFSGNPSLLHPSHRSNMKVEPSSAKDSGSEARVVVQPRGNQQTSGARLLSQHGSRNSDAPQSLGPPRERRLSDIPQWPGPQGIPSSASGQRPIEFSRGQIHNIGDPKDFSGFSKPSRNQSSELPRAQFGHRQSIRSNPDVNPNFRNSPINQRSGSPRSWRPRSGSYHQARQPASSSEQRRPSISQQRPPVPNFPSTNPGPHRPSSTTYVPPSKMQRSAAPPPLEPLPASSSTAHSKDIYLDIANTCKMNFPYAMIAERHAVSLQMVYDLFTDVVEVPLRQASARYQRAESNQGGERLQSRVVDGQRRMSRGSQQVRDFEN